MISSHLSSFTFVPLQNEREQIMTTNLWLCQVRYDIFSYRAYRWCSLYNVYNVWVCLSVRGFINALSAGVERLPAEMGPRKVRRHQETAHTIQTHLASRYSALQQVSVCIRPKTRAACQCSGDLVLWCCSKVILIIVIKQTVFTRVWSHTHGLQCVITGVTYSSTKRFSSLTIKALGAENLLNKHVFRRDFLIKIFCILSPSKPVFCWSEGD